MLLTQIRKVRFDTGRAAGRRGNPRKPGMGGEVGYPALLEIDAADKKLKFDVTADCIEEARNVLNHAGLIS